MPPRLVTVAEASAVLGLSDKAIRRRLKTGELRAEQRQTPQGFTWLIELPATASAPGLNGLNGAHPAGQPAPPPGGGGRVDGAVDAQEEAAPPAGRQVDDQATTSPPAALLAELAETKGALAVQREAVTRLEAHLSDLRATVDRQAEELAERRREAQELRALVGIVAQATRALPSPEDETRRVDGEVDGDQASTPPADQTGTSPPSTRAGRRPWWRFWE
jgi:hypothetical protein